MKNKQGMHIAFIDFDSLKNHLLAGGQARATYEVGKRLVTLGHQVTVYCSKYPGYQDRTIDGITYKHIGVGTGNIRLNNALYILLLPFTLIHLKVDIIIECFTAPISTLFSPVFTKIPVVALTSSFDAERFSKLYHFPFEPVERFGLRFYQYALPLSTYYEQKMREVNPKLISQVVPEGVGEEFFLIKRKKPEYILFLGRFDMDQKGIDLLLKAYAQVKDSIRYPLVLAGMGPDEEKIKKLIVTLGLEQHVRLIGPTYGKKKQRTLEHALFVALPSRHETFSCFALEALAAGLPLAHFGIPGLRWIAGDVAIKARPFQVADYANALLQLTKQQEAKSLETETRSFASQFSWDNVAAEYSAFLTDVIALEQGKRRMQIVKLAGGMAHE